MTIFAPVTKPDRSRSSSQATRSAISCGLADAARGMLRVVLAAERAVVAGLDPPGAYAVHANVRTEADGERVRERDEAAFRRGVGFGVAFGHQRAGGRDGDKGALALAQRGLGGTGEEKGGGQVGVDHMTPFGERQAPQRLADHDAGIGHNRVEPAEARERCRRRHGRPCFLGATSPSTSTTRHSGGEEKSAARARALRGRRRRPAIFA